MVTGSIASSLLGQPRSTHDIDIVVAMAPEHISILASAFPPPDFYLSTESVRDAVRNQSMFNLLDISGGDKVDFWILTNDPFDQSRFARRRPHNAGSRQISVSSPEDIILAKLRWAELSGGSEKQFQDALRVFEVQHASLDMQYLNDWSARLGIEPLWQRLQGEAEIV
ncbi:MAG: hypothetical protein ACREHD_32580 [Pirellulales bacterium]